MSPTRKGAHAATSFDVAELAGVSRATVSRILNGDDGSFPDTTKKRVLDAATRLKYRPSTAARSLKRGQSDTIVILMPETRFGVQLQAAVDQVAKQTQPFNGNVVVRVAGDNMRNTLDALTAMRPAAVINFGVLSPVDAAVLSNSSVLVVPQSLSGEQQPVQPYPGIARLQVEALRRQGPRPVWYADTYYDRPEPFSEMRLAELRQELASDSSAGLRVVRVDLTVQGGKEALSRILADGEPAAVACYNDEVALALLAGAEKLGVEVPRQVALVGMDDITSGQLWTPRLTTIHVDMHEIISGIVLELRWLLEGKTVPGSRIAGPVFTLVDGETT